MINEKVVDVLNTLIIIHNDRIEGYETASKETLEADLKTLFAGFAQTSEQCKAQIEHEIHKLGGILDEGTRITGKFFRVWMDVKAALTGNNLKTVLNSCAYGDDMACETYKTALSENVGILTAEQETLLKAQYALIKADHNTIKALRDAVVLEHA